MTNYASGTSVNSDRSRAEIETTLSRFGATVYDRMAPALEASRGKPNGVVLAIMDGKRG